MAQSFDLYQHVTDSIIASIEAGTPAWRKPWTGEKGGAPFPLRSNGEPYSGINVLMLWLAADTKGYRAPFWFTYRQAQEAGGQVRKGEKSATVVKYGTFEREDKETGEERRLPYLKSYSVFNAEQIEGLETAMTSRHTIGMAQGILMERYQLIPDQAFALLQRMSSTSNTKLRAVADGIVVDRVRQSDGT